MRDSRPGELLFLTVSCFKAKAHLRSPWITVLSASTFGPVAGALREPANFQLITAFPWRMTCATLCTLRA